MTGREVIDWIRENAAEDAEIYVEMQEKLYKPSTGFDVLGRENGYGIVVIR